MKVRNGFVSNSSTSSFCIYGTELDQDEFFSNLTDEAKKALKVQGGLGATNEDGEEDEDGEGWFETRDCFETKAFQEVLGVEVEVHSYDGGYIYVGRSYSKIGDDETGAQFKAKVAADIAKLFKLKTPKLSHLHEAWHD